jgi:hypothetical protein
MPNAGEPELDNLVLIGETLSRLPVNFFYLLCQE